GPAAPVSPAGPTGAGADPGQQDGVGSAARLDGRGSLLARDLARAGAVLDGDLARLRAVRDRDAQRQHAVVVGRVDRVHVDVTTQGELTREATGRALLGQPAGTLRRADRALGRDRQGAAVHVEVDRARVDAGQVDVDDVVVVHPVQVHRHPAGGASDAVTGEQPGRQPVHL